MGVLNRYLDHSRASRPGVLKVGHQADMQWNRSRLRVASKEPCLTLESLPMKNISTWLCMIVPRIKAALAMANMQVQAS